MHIVKSDNSIKTLPKWDIKVCPLYILLLFFVAIGSAWAKPDFTQINAAYKYDPTAAVQCHYVLAATEDSLHVYFKIDIKEGDFAEDYTLGYELKSFYGEKPQVTVDSLRLEDFLLTKESQTYYLKIPLKVTPGMSLMLFKIKNVQASFYYDIYFGTEDHFAPTSLVLMESGRDIPVFAPYISKGDAFRIIDSFDATAADNLYYYQYKHSFSPALPPMAGKSDQVDRSLTIDSTFSVPIRTVLTLDQEALYFVQSDTATLQGIAFRIVESYYPKYGKAEELIAPLIYISTKREMTKLSQASEGDQKKALDKYWLELIKTPSRAKTIIRSFYSQVEAANATFTTYKEGWKTDQGMIYTLYGVPDEVYFNGREEQWIYKKNDGISRVKFTFVKIKNIFTDRHLELLRSKSYESFWFGNVELWRKGIKGL